VDCGLGIEWDRLRLAKQMPNSPFADAGPDEVALADGKLVSKLDASRAVSIMDAMRHGAVDRIEQEKSTSFADDGSMAHNTHSAVFAEVKVDQQLGVIRVTRVPARDARDAAGCAGCR
jgi:xanthine dehydrogenase YagR molybdenum-binding subunit